MIIDLSVPRVDVQTYSDVFWSEWLQHRHEIEFQIRMVCLRMRYYGDVEDVIGETLVLCREKWHRFRRDGNFTAWAAYQAKAYLTNLYRHNRPMPSLQEPIDEDGHALEDVVATPGLGVEDIVINDMELKQLMLLHRDTLAGRVLEAMAALVDDNMKLSLRNIAAVANISHTQVATELATLRINGDVL